MIEAAILAMLPLARIYESRKKSDEYDFAVYMSLNFICITLIIFT